MQSALEFLAKIKNILNYCGKKREKIKGISIVLSCYRYVELWSRV